MFISHHNRGICTKTDTVLTNKSLISLFCEMPVTNHIYAILHEPQLATAVVNFSIPQTHRHDFLDWHIILTRPNPYMIYLGAIQVAVWWAKFWVAGWWTHIPTIFFDCYECQMHSVKSCTVMLNNNVPSLGTCCKAKSQLEHLSIAISTGGSL
jgi:hypothetical protein